VTDRSEVDPGTDESTLLAAVRDGDPTVFRALYRRETPGMYRLALQIVGGAGEDAEDVVQEAWHRAVRGLPGFEGRSSLRTWLKAIVARCALEAVRLRRRDGASPVGADDCAPTTAGRSSDPPSERMDLERAFERLAPGFRAVLVLHDVEGYRHQDIAKLLGITAGTSKSQLSRARARLREDLGDDYVTR
jgi:RNA polymerase sigma factor (sigma-70 family)